jgi:hypothetical protein
VAGGAVRLNNDPIRDDTLLLIGDRLSTGARTWLVTG